MLNINELKFTNNLIPVVTQSYYSGKVLMQAYANLEAINLTISTGYATYFSRSRKSLWIKGESSGNKQQIIDIKVDCDNDSLLYLVKELGPACHTNNYSCYFRSLVSAESKPSAFEIITDLYAKIVGRKEQSPEESYVARLFNKGSDKIIQKVGEEAIETVIGLKNKNSSEIIYESSDLIFHLLVALVDAGVTIDQIEDELLKRYK